MSRPDAVLLDQVDVTPTTTPPRRPYRGVLPWVGAAVAAAGLLGARLLTDRPLANLMFAEGAAAVGVIALLVGAAVLAYQAATYLSCSSAIPAPHRPAVLRALRRSGPIAPEHLDAALQAARRVARQASTQGHALLASTLGLGAVAAVCYDPAHRLPLVLLGVMLLGAAYYASLVRRARAILAEHDPA